MTTTDIDAIRQREQAADSGPWRVVEEHGRDIADEAYHRLTVQTAVRYGESREIAEMVDPDHSWASKLSEENAEFIAHARTDVLTLLAKVDELTAERDLASDLLDGTAKALGLDLDNYHVHHEVPAKVAELVSALAANERSEDARLAIAEAELEKVRAHLTAANRRNDGLQADLNSATKANTAWANENLRLREQVFAQKPVIDAAEAWAELRDSDGITLADSRKADAALYDAVESYRLMDLALTSARDEAGAAA